MTRTLVTGGSGYLAGHIIEQLLQRGHSVVTTVRTQQTADRLRTRYRHRDREEFSVVIVQDVSQEGACDETLLSDPPIGAVIHPTSPFHFAVTDIQTQLLDPAIRGTTGILRSIQKHAPSVERVVITSSLAAMIHPWAGDWPGNWPGHTYSEDDWNPITPEQAYQDPLCGYRASKKQAEQAAWRFMREEQPTFTLATICPPLMLGPTASGDLWDGDLGHVNESLKRVRDMVFGQARADHAIPPNGASFIFTDVRDAARYHVLAMEKPAAAGQRCFIPTGWFCNREIVDIARKHFPELEHSLPPIDTPGGGYPADGLYKVDNSRTQAIFDGDFERFRSLEECIVDTVKSLQAVLEGGPAREGS